MRNDLFLFQGFHLIHPVKLLLAAPCHFCLASRDILSDKFFCFADLLLLRRILADIIFPQQGFLAQKLGIGAVILRDRIVVYIADAVCDFVQKGKVVGTTKKAFSKADRYSASHAT